MKPRMYRSAETSEFTELGKTGALRTHLRKDKEHGQFIFQVTISRPKATITLIQYSEIEVKLFEGKNEITMVPRHPPTFVKLEGNDVGLYEIKEQHFDVAHSAEVQFKGKTHKFQFGSPHLGLRSNS
jgi:hypothetical protein